MQKADWNVGSEIMNKKAIYEEFGWKAKVEILKDKSNKKMGGVPS